MNFTPIALNTWKRKEIFEQYYNQTPCTYSLTTNISVKKLRTFCLDNGFSFFPSLLWFLSSSVNKIQEFKITINDNVLGFYDTLSPCYAVFNKETELFGSIWTEYSNSFKTFHLAYEKDMKEYAPPQSLFPKKEAVPIFHISNIPFFSFTSFHLHLPKSTEYFTPIFTLGKISKEQDDSILPLAIQVHHAVCDGYHVGKFIDIFQKSIIDCNID